jgi:succinate dehydrogenase / fumarate reductase cytochrome b subunit
VSDQRPVNLDISTLELPLPARVSILHRISGAAIFFGVAILLWMLGTSLSSPEGFAQVQECMSSFVAKAIVWLVCVGIIYHTAAGIRHLVMDVGIGESFEAGVVSARLVFASAIFLSILAGVWIW